MDQRLRTLHEYSSSDWLKSSLLAQVCMVQLYGQAKNFYLLVILSLIGENQKAKTSILPPSLSFPLLPSFFSYPFLPLPSIFWI